MRLGHLTLITDNTNNDNSNKPFVKQGLPQTPNTSHPIFLRHTGMGEDRRKANLDPVRELGC